MLVNIVLDIILVAILVIGAIWGIKKGFIGAIAKPVKLTLALVMSYTTCRGLSEKIVMPLISHPISSQIAEILKSKYSDITSVSSGDLPTLVKLAAIIGGIDLNNIEADGAEYIDLVIARITEPAVSVISLMISFVLLFIVLMVIFSVLIYIIDRMIDNGVAGAMNKIAGCLFTLVFAFGIVWCIASSIEFIFSVPALAETEAIKEFTGGFIYRFFKSFSPVDLLLSF